MEIRPLMEQLLDEETDILRKYGGVGLDEANSPAIMPDEGWEEWMSKEAQDKIVAICSIVNGFHEIYEDIVKTERERYKKEMKVRTGVLKYNLYSIEDPPSDCAQLTKEQAEEIICLWLEKGTKCTYNNLEGCWEEDGNCCTIEDEHVQEIFNAVD
jgi:hypothetical protein